MELLTIKRLLITLASAGGWIQVDEGQGPLSVMVDHIHSADWPTLNEFTQPKEMHK